MKVAGAAAAVGGGRFRTRMKSGARCDEEETVVDDDGSKDIFASAGTFDGVAVSIWRPETVQRWARYRTSSGLSSVLV